MNLRYVVVGLGNIGAKRQKSLGSRCVGTVDPVNPAADYKRIDDVPLNCYEVVVLSVPNQVKMDLLHRILATRKHVLVEKPLLFPDCATADALKDLASRNSVIWYTSYNHRLEPLIVRVKELIEQESIGPVYHARLLYGNGTVQNCIGTWRESGYGVLEDLGCHLIDLTEFLFRHKTADYMIWEASRVESRVFDHCVFATADRKIVLECATTMWKNRFEIDVYGQLGSLHLRGLCKWGPSELSIHQRVFPSGGPVERRETVDEGDCSWQMDIEEFERSVQLKKTSYTNDLRIFMSLSSLSQSAAILPQNPES